MLLLQNLVNLITKIFFTFKLEKKFLRVFRCAENVDLSARTWTPGTLKSSKTSILKFGSFSAFINAFDDFDHVRGVFEHSHLQFSAYRKTLNKVEKINWIEEILIQIGRR